MAFRQIDSVGVMVEWESSSSNRQVDAIGTQFEWRLTEYRRVDSIGVMFEYDGPYIPISGLATGLSLETGTLINILPVYKMSDGDFRATGTLNGNVYIQGLNESEAIVNGTLFGKLKLSGTIEDNILITSYLWSLNKLKMLSIGVLNINNQLDGFLHLNGYDLSNANVPHNDVIGFGHLHGLTEGETYFTLRVKGVVPIANITFAVTYTKGLILTFNQNAITMTIQNTLFTYNGKQLVFPI
jgi:hypothetical protein